MKKKNFKIQSVNEFKYKFRRRQTNKQKNWDDKYFDKNLLTNIIYEQQQNKTKINIIKNIYVNALK